ncbi:MAG: hypothetical protein ACOC26_00290, partial [Halochromatium sp.]
AKLLISAQATLRQALKAFDTAMGERAKANVEPGSPGGPGKRRTPARPGVPSTSASKGTSKPNWIDELRERREQQAPKQAG